MRQIRVFYYCIRTAFNGMVAYGKINIVVIISFAFGIVLPMLCFGNINVFVSSLGSIELINSKDTSVIDFIAKSDEIKALSAISDDDCEIALVAGSAQNIRWDDISVTTSIYAITPDLMNFEQFDLVSGEMDASNFETCLVSLGFISRYGDINIGDTISVAGRVLTVSGVFSSMRYYGNILISYETYESITDISDVLGKLYLRATDDKISFIVDAMSSIVDVSKIATGDELFRSTIRQSISISAVPLLISIVGLTFAIINISLVLVGKIMHLKRSIGIKLTLGASDSNVMIGLMAENTSFFVISFIIALGLSHFAISISPQNMAFVMNFGVYALTFALGFFMVLIVTYISLRGVLKSTLPSIMSNT